MHQLHPVGDAVADRPVGSLTDANSGVAVGGGLVCCATASSIRPWDYMVMYIVDLEARINDALALRDYVQVTALCKLHEAAVLELDSMRCGMVTA